MSTTRKRARGTLIRQGDVLLIPCDPNDLGRNTPPKERRAVKRVGGRLVLATGEATGHAHAILEPHAQLEEQYGTHWGQERGRWGAPIGRPKQLLDGFPRRTVLVVTGEPATLVHEEHDPLIVPPGAWAVRRQREYRPSPSGRAWTRVND